MLTRLKSTFKVYAVTLLTAILLMAVVGLYIFQVIPENERKLNKEYYQTLYQLREKFDKITEDLSKQVAIKDKVTYCQLNEDNADSIIITNEGVRIVKMQQGVESSGIFSFSKYYYALFNNSEFNLAICNPADSSKVLHFNGESEPNELLIPDGKKQDYYIVKDSLVDTRYYFYFFKPKFSQQRIALVIGVNMQVFAHRTKAFDTSKTLFAILAMLLLFLIAPLLKSVSGSRFEELHVFDVVSSTSAIGLICMLGLIFLLSYATFCALNERQTEKLQLASQRLTGNFETEVKEYKSILYLADRFITYKRINCGDAANIKGMKARYPSIFDGRFAFAKNNLARFFRLNKFGYLLQDEYPPDNATSNCHTNFNERRYFQYQQNNHDSDKIYAEPLISWLNNQLRITISKHYQGDCKDTSNCGMPVVSALSFSPMSCRYYTLPPDYGFAVIDNTGKVQMHSDSTKNLSENIFDELEDSLWIKKSIFFNRTDVNCQKYHGQKTLICLRPIAIPGNLHQLYLVMFKNTIFADNLILSSVIDTFIISMIYILIIVAFTYGLSVIYFEGHIKKFSGFHFSWLFPNDLNNHKYPTLVIIDVLAIMLIFVTAIFLDYAAVLFLALNIGLFTIFLHFVIIVKKQPWTLLQATGLVGVLVVNLGIIRWIPADHFLLKIILEFISYTFYLKRIMPCKNEVPSDIKRNNVSQHRFAAFITSSIGLHYIFIPMLVFISIIYCEHETAGFLRNAGLQQQYNAIPDDVKSISEKTSFSFDIVGSTSDRGFVFDETTEFDKLISSLFQPRPSNYYLSKLEPVAINENQVLNNSISDSLSLYRRFEHLLSLDTILLFLFMIVILVSITYTLIYVFADRFFFFDLRNVSNVLLKDGSAGLISTDLKPELVPPYNAEIANYILSAENIEGNSADMKALFDFNGGECNYPKRLAIANYLNKQVNIKVFSSYWEQLSKQEKFVLADLAKDNFINYRNKDILITLMQREYVVADPATGRIRLVSYAFRQFIMDWIDENPKYFTSENSDVNKSAWATWQLPATIIAGTILMFLFYINNEQYNTLLSFSAGIGGAIGLVLKFISTYQSIIPKAK